MKSIMVCARMCSYGGILGGDASLVMFLHRRRRLPPLSRLKG